MSISAMNWAWKQDVTPAEKLVLLALADHANEDDQCWPRQVTIAAKCGMSRQSLSRKVAHLEEVGLISRQVRMLADGRGRRADLYQLHASADQCNPGVTEKTVTNVNTQPDQCNENDPTNVKLPPDQCNSGVTIEPTGIPKEPKKNTHARTRARDTDPLFDEFWDTYRKKRGRGHAVKAWNTAVKKTDPASIIEAARSFRAWCDRNETEDRFVPHAATWLNGERWDDELTETRELTVTEQLALREERN